MKTKREVVIRLNELCEQLTKNYHNPAATDMMRYMVHGQIRGLCFVLGVIKPTDAEIIGGWRYDAKLTEQ